MKFGKLNNIEEINFAMPPDPELTKKKLANLQSCTDTVQIYSGCTGWSMKEWVGTYYPPGTKSNGFLEAYAQQFNSIELNSTYYKIPDKATLERWSSQTETGFKFAPKIPQMISQSSDLGLNSSFIDNFCNNISYLGDKLGISFLQLPPNFAPKHIRILENFLERFPINDIPLSIEIRNENWFVKPDMETLQQLLSHYGAGTVISDVAGRRDVLHMYLSNESAMIRFVGNNLHHTDFSRIDSWIERLSIWIKNGLKTIYFFHHQENNLHAPEIALYFNNKLNESLSINLKLPKKHFDTQMTLF